MRSGDYFIQRLRMQVAARWIPPDSRLLDIGCHQGEFFQFLGNRINPSIGIDPLLEKDNLKIPGNHKLYQLMFRELLPFADLSFDVVSMLAVIEHIKEKDLIAKECRRLIRTGGRVVITVPSKMVDQILSLLIFFQIIDGMSLEEHHGFNPGELPSIFLSEGFKIIARRKFQLGLNNLFVFEKQ